MAVKIGSLLIELAVEHGVLKSGLSKAEKEVQASVKRIEKQGRQIANFGKSMSAAITGPVLAAAAAATAAVTKMAGDVKEMRLAADVAGAGFEEFQRASHAALVGAGIESEKLGDILKDTADKIGDFAATGGGEMKDFFENIAAPQGLSVDEFLGKSSVEQLRLYVQALENAGVSSEEMVFYLESIADEGSRLLPVLQANGAELDRLGQNAEVIDEGTAERLRRYTDAQTELGKAAQALTIALVDSGLVELLVELATGAAEWLRYFAELSPMTVKVIAVVGGLAAVLGPIVMTIGGIVSGVGGFIAALGGLPMVLSVVGGALNVLLLSPLGLIVTAVAAVIAAFYYWDEIKEIVSRVYRAVKEWMVDKLGAIFDWVGRKVEAVSGFFADMYDAVVGNSYVPDMVDGIAAQMARLEAEMVDPAQAATRSVTAAAREMAANVKGLLDRLFPDLAEARRRMQELALLDSAGLPDDVRAEARLRLLGAREEAPVSFDEGPLDEARKVEEAADKVAGKMADLAKKNEVQTVRVAESFRDMAQGAIRALDDMVNAIRGGGFLDILGSVINFGLQLGSIGAFGSDLARNINSASVPGFANGTGFAPGGLALVGERGPELVNLPRGSQVIPNHELREARESAPMNITVTPSPYFDVRVDGRIVQAAPAVANAGAMRAQAMGARSARRRVR